MANPNPKHLQRLMEGVEAWNAWRRQHSDIIPDLCTINFGGADLTGVMLVLSQDDFFCSYGQPKKA
jgi:hypothetical protein